MLLVIEHNHKEVIVCSELHSQSNFLRFSSFEFSNDFQDLLVLLVFWINLAQFVFVEAKYCQRKYKRNPDHDNSLQ